MAKEKQPGAGLDQAAEGGETPEKRAQCRQEFEAVLAGTDQAEKIAVARVIFSHELRDSIYSDQAYISDLAQATLEVASIVRNSAEGQLEIIKRMAKNIASDVM